VNVRVWPKAEAQVAFFSVSFGENIPSYLENRGEIRTTTEILY